MCSDRHAAFRVHDYVESRILHLLRANQDTLCEFAECTAGCGVPTELAADRRLPFTRLDVLHRCACHREAASLAMVCGQHDTKAWGISKYLRGPRDAEAFLVRRRPV